MTKYSLAAILAAVTLSLSTSAAFSQTKDATMAVSMTVSGECTLAASPIAFPAQTLLTADVDVTGTISVRCTKGTAYTVALDEGLGAGADATTGVRYMTKAGDATQLASYTIHQTSATGTIWSNVAGLTVASATGGATGATESLPFVAVLASSTTQSLATGVYGDTVTATITYDTAVSTD